MGASFGSSSNTFSFFPDHLFTELIIGLGGTLTAEHGDGRVRAPYLARRFPRLVSLFETIKKTLDPENLMNPGVILPLPGQQVEHHLRYPEAR